MIENKEDTKPTPRAISAVIFSDPYKWLKDEAEYICHLDGISSMDVSGDPDMDAAVAVTVFDECDESQTAGKGATPDELVDALRKMCELIDGKKLFVGGLTSSHELTDTGNWDVEVTDAYWQIVYHGEVIYG